MPKLFVEKSIELNAPASKVWEALTKREYTDQWAGEFSSGGPAFHIESDWKLGSPVLWKGEDGTTAVEGNVTALEPNRYLRYTVADTRGEKLKMTDEDGIAYTLTGHNGKTTLHVKHGDFSAMPEGEHYHHMSEKVWDRVLPRIKQLAEK